MEVIDFNECKENDRDYGGNAGEKLGIIFNEENWFLKFPKSTVGMNRIDISYTTSPLSEYIGSHVYEALGISTHETLLGEKDGKIVVACKDFLKEGEKLKEFKNLKNMYNKDLTELLANESSSGSGDGTNLKVVLAVIEKNKVLKNVEGVKERFWDMFVVDALINNNDRNNGNWGVIMHCDSSKSLTPVYDNGNCFNNKASPLKLLNIFKDKNQLENIAYKSTFCIYSGDDNKLINPNQFILSAENEDCNKAVKRIFERFDLHKIYKIIDEIPCEYHKIPVLDDIYKVFIKVTLRLRKEDILDKAIEIIRINEKQCNIKKTSIKEQMNLVQTKMNMNLKSDVKKTKNKER